MPTPPVRSGTSVVDSGRPLRLLYVIDSLGYGGAEHSLVQLLPHYRARGVDTTIACLVTRMTTLREEAAAAGVEVIDVGEGRRTTSILTLRRLIRSLKPDLIHTTLFEGDIAGRLASVGMRTPVLTSLVNTQYEPSRAAASDIPSWKLNLARAAERWTGRLWTDHYHVNSLAVRDAAARRLGIRFEDMTVVPRGRDPERYAPRTTSLAQVRRELGLGEDARIILCIGRQEPQKGHVHLIEAMGALRDRDPGARLLIVGSEGAATADILRLVKQFDLPEHVQFLGRRDDVPELMRAADVLALPSLWEGLPNVVIEAMATGLAIVATDISPVREAVVEDGTALLVPPRDGPALAEALGRLLDDSRLRAQLARQGRQVFLEHFTIGPVADRMVALYSQLVEGSRTRPRGRQGTRHMRTTSGAFTGDPA
jgi:glycosyltransferase involved in cell wall biosynthesis